MTIPPCRLRARLSRPTRLRSHRLLACTRSSVQFMIKRKSTLLCITCVLRQAQYYTLDRQVKHNSKYCMVHMIQEVMQTIADSHRRETICWGKIISRVIQPANSQPNPDFLFQEGSLPFLLLQKLVENPHWPWVPGPAHALR